MQLKISASIALAASFGALGAAAHAETVTDTKTADTMPFDLRS